ncbi:unnamed protein product [Mytilus edulis]|uniref:MD-2-related lipid-recognition domain-containing protein n=1 Tax=Mytilus edulis TaxID=6550 RepID=A0A8S3RM52_MYTED|nr:unnamed protein product [Mytilus edulis]
MADPQDTGINFAVPSQNILSDFIAMELDIPSPSSTHSETGALKSIDIGCAGVDVHNNCRLQRGTNVSISTNFTSNVNTNKVTTVVHGILNGVAEVFLHLLSKDGEEGVRFNGVTEDACISNVNHCPSSTHSKTGVLKSIDIGCAGVDAHNNCRLQRGTHVSISTNFTSNVNTNKVTTVVHGILNGVAEVFLHLLSTDGEEGVRFNGVTEDACISNVNHCNITKGR